MTDSLSPHQPESSGGSNWQFTTTPASSGEELLGPRITVIGVGGAGGNAVNNMIRLNLQGGRFVACNTDAQALSLNLAPERIQLGTTITEGLGAGSRPEVGQQAAEESAEEIVKALADTHMLFITAGMGGGTGTGAAPVVARLAKEQGILTVGVVTKPFDFEGMHRRRSAERGIEQLSEHVDTLIVIPNQNLFRIADEKTTFADAFKMADDVLHSGVRGVTDLIIQPGVINLDFADIKVVMSEMGKAMMGTGEASGEGRAISAAEAAISNPLLDEISMRGAQGLLINVTGGPDLTLHEVNEAANRISEEVDSDANIIFGSAQDPEMEGRIRVSVVATGIEMDLPHRAPISNGVMRPSGSELNAHRPNQQTRGPRRGPGRAMGQGQTTPAPRATATSPAPAGLTSALRPSPEPRLPEHEQQPAVVARELAQKEPSSHKRGFLGIFGSKKRNHADGEGARDEPLRRSNAEPRQRDNSGGRPLGFDQMPSLGRPMIRGEGAGIACRSENHSADPLLMPAYARRQVGR